MKKTIILHIGSPKTGTTSIQKYIHSNSDQLAQNGYFVPKGLHAELPLSLLHDHHRSKGLMWPTFWPLPESNSDEVWSQVRQQIERAGCSKIIISAENFCELADFNDDDGSDPFGFKLKSYLSGYEIKVLVYVRPLAEHANSMYKELIKNGPEIRSGEDVLCWLHKQKSMHIYPTKYLDYFTGLFGKGSLTLRKYSIDNFYKNDVVCDFLKAIEYPFVEEPDHKVLHENMSIPDEDVYIKRLFNVVGIEDVALNQLMAKYLIRANSVASSGGKRRDCSYQLLNQAVADETQNILDRYSLDLGSDLIKQNVGAQTAEHVDGFLISMLAHVISQNERLSSRLENIERSLLEVQNHQQGS
ncbi:MAG: hypothetical protein Q7U24_02670 [Sulfurimicrobium sp.]|nr:hypothetical protein [Sulfurimicrobium sp.]